MTQHSQTSSIYVQIPSILSIQYHPNNQFFLCLLDERYKDVKEVLSLAHLLDLELGLHPLDFYIVYESSQEPVDRDNIFVEKIFDNMLAKNSIMKEEIFAKMDRIDASNKIIEEIREKDWPLFE